MEGAREERGREGGSQREQGKEGNFKGGTLRRTLPACIIYYKRCMVIPYNDIVLFERWMT